MPAEIISLQPLQDALIPTGWYAEWVSGHADDHRVMLYRPQGGQAHDRFDFDPSNQNDNSPWEHPVFPAIGAVDRALLDLCSVCR